jgi:hypothetical protein
LNSILKDQKIEIDVSSIKDIKSLFFKHYSKYQDESLSKHNVVIKKIGNYRLLKGLSESLHIPTGIEAYSDVYKRYVSEIQDTINQRELIAKTPLQENTYLFLTEILYLEILVYKIREGLSYQSNLKKFNLLTKNRFSFLNIERTHENKHNKKGRASLIEPNSNAIIWTRKTRQPITYNINALISSINPELIEIPSDFDKKRLLNALSYIDMILKNFEIINRDFIIRFKKLGTYKKKGMYIKPQKTIILDAKHIHLFQHELGHFLFEENIPFSYKNEIYNKKKMEEMVKHQKIIDVKLEDKLKNLIKDEEGYKIDSEIFANWFENLITRRSNSI